MFSLRIVTTDHRMDVPIPGLDATVSEFCNKPAHKVPIIRIFGSTTSGQKACLCLHGVFPYLYVAMDTDIPPSEYQLLQFSTSLDKALNVALGRTSSSSQHVYKVVVVSGIPFYGYHAKECLFLKIFLYSPYMVKKVADLLLGGAVMNRSFQPHESHIPYVLQMFMDFNLFGMNFIHLSDVKFRLPLPLNEGSQWNSLSVTSEMLCCEKRSTNCELEVDGLACNILNRKELSGKMAGNPGLLALWQEERLRCRMIDMPSQLTPPPTPDRVPDIITAELRLENKFVEILNSFKKEPTIQEIVKSSNDTFSEEDSEPIICERSILDVVSHSENFLEENSLNQNASHYNNLCDSSFANLLVDLAVEHKSSQKKTLMEMEEWDSVLSQNSVKDKITINRKDGDDNDDDEDDNDDLVNLEMSQCFDPPKDHEPLQNKEANKHKLSDDEDEMKIVKKMKTSSSPLKTRKMLRMKSFLFKRRNQNPAENLSDETKFTSLRNKFHSFRLKNSKVLVVDRIPANYDAIHASNFVCSDKLLTGLMQKLKNDINKESKSVEMKPHESPQHGALEDLAFLSSPDSSINLHSFPSLNETIDEKSNVSVPHSPCSREDDTLTEQNAIKDKIMKVINANQSHGVHRQARNYGSRQTIKFESIIVPMSYVEVEKDLVRGDVGGTLTTSRNAEIILERRLVLSKQMEGLRLQPDFVEDLTEHDSCDLPNGLNDIKQILKNKEETSTCSKKKKKTRHILSQFLDDEQIARTTPHKSPPTFDDVMSSLKINSQENAPTKKKIEEFKKKKESIPSFNPPEMNEVSKISSPQVDPNHEVKSSHSTKICSSTPFHHHHHHHHHHHDAIIPPHLNITPISKTFCGNHGNDPADEMNKSDDTTLVNDANQNDEKMSKVNIVNKLKSFRSQIDAATPANTFNFKVDSQNLQELKNTSENQFLCIVSLELHVTSRGQLNPDPEFDTIAAAFYHISDQRPSVVRSSVNESVFKNQKSFMSSANSRTGEGTKSTKDVVAETRLVSGVFIFLEQQSNVPIGGEIEVGFCKSEMEVIMNVVELVKRYDADMLVGYEVQKSSWGFLIQRAAVLDIFLPAKLSRFEECEEISKKKDNFPKEKTDEEMLFSSDVFVPGRIILNLWRILRHEVSLNVYSFENAIFHILHRRLPHFSFQVLTSWFKHSLNRWKTMEYYLTRCKGNVQILDQLDLIGQTSEFARIYGIEFFDVLNRGSQYRVESMMLRLAKPQNFIAVSPSVQQRAAMRSPECIPLNLEPRSDFYTDPVVVLDFQSLYPSIMIAYNYCFSTCLGRMQHFAKANDGPFEFGCTSINVPVELLESLKDDVNICSNGVVFVKSRVRKGIIPSMVEEILNTRLMVKKAMKVHKADKGLQRMLHSRQLGLKLIANVTFGYTSANFSGRMACVEVGDSIMRKARDTLEAAISLVERNVGWGAEVVYGDTDSMFVLLRGRTKEQAFKIGQEIADAVTRSNPKPVKLKLEKVYLPCVLQTKKRYVGFMYESNEQKEAIFDAKGIETVRRDNCPVVSKILEKSLKILFTTCDLNQVKSYVQKQSIKVIDGRTSLQDFIFAKEYKGVARYQPTASIPALEITRQRLLRDRRSEPLVGERVPYVIVCGTSDQPLIKLVRQPHEVMEDKSLKINSAYYLLKQVLPTINRFTMFFGINALQWFQDMPRTLKLNHKLFGSVFFEQYDQQNLNQYFGGGDCIVCGETCSSDKCKSCEEDDQKRLLLIYSQVRKNQARIHGIEQICTLCKGWQESLNSCSSIDCPILFQHFKSATYSDRIENLMKLQDLNI